MKGSPLQSWFVWPVCEKGWEVSHSSAWIKRKNIQGSAAQDGKIIKQPFARLKEPLISPGKITPCCSLTSRIRVLETGCNQHHPASGLGMGFVVCLRCNKLSKDIHLEVPKRPVFNSANVIQKLNQDANLAEHACFTKTKKIISWRLGRGTFLCNISILKKLDFFQRKKGFREYISTSSTGTQLK